MKYSVIIPVYNTEKYLRQCVESVLHQSFDNFEIILVDDGSPDNCPAICDELKEGDPRVKVIHQKNAGPGIARNAGIEIAEGDCLLFLDSDDFWLDDCVLEKIDEQIAGYDLAVFDYACYADGVLGKPNCDCNRALQSSYDTGAAYLCDALKIRDSYAWSFFMYVFHRRLFTDPSLRFPSQKSGEDVALLYRVVIRAEKVLVFKKCLYAYRQERADSASKAFSYSLLHGILEVVERETDQIKEMSALSDELRALLLNVFCFDYFFVLTASNRIPKPERKKIWDELDRLKDVARFGLGKRQVKAGMIRVLGVRGTAGMIELKRAVLKK